MRQNFQAGILDLEIRESLLPPEELFAFAERQNPRRAFLFASRVLGRHIPVAPSAMRRIWRLLAARLRLKSDSPALFVGMAETAIALGAGLFRECGQPGLFLADTRHEFQRPVLAGFSEDHSHAASHRLYLPAEPGFLERPWQVVAVDDEMTTGATFAHLREALAGAGLRMLGFTRVVILDWSGAGEAVSLLRGAWNWRWRKRPEGFPPNPWPGGARAAISRRQDWGRFGALNVSLCPWPHAHASPGSRVLVLGSGEFVWPPYLLAERLENEGARVLFGATTRSPIKKGMAIKNVVEFPDNYGLGLPNYLYNVDPEKFDRIFLCVETGAAAVSPLLAGALKKADILEYQPPDLS